MKNRLTAMLLTAALIVSIIPIVTRESPAAVMEAIPAQYTNEVRTIHYESKSWEPFSKAVPIYAIQQFNGYYSNYVKLRDVAYYLDFDVVWSENEPNAMRLYSNRYYLDAHVDEGPATETKQATASTMDIYVDDVKVTTDIVPVMIENNNYFKIRDIAQLMDFWCQFISNQNGKVVILDANYHYVDETAINNGAEKGNYTKTVEYESPAWYDESCGTVSSTPVVYSGHDPWGNYNYTNLYFGKTDTTMNAIAQLMLDRDIIEQDHSGVEQFKEENTLNRYYRYPVIEYEQIIPQHGGLVYAPKGADATQYKFAQNLKIYPISDRIGVLSIVYNEESETNQCIESTRLSANQILKEMEIYSCDREKIMFLAYQVCQKMTYSSRVEAVDREQTGIPDDILIKKVPKTYEELSHVWDNDDMYCGVCEDYTEVFGFLLAAAGYYSVPEYSTYNHDYNAVWVPDEGAWITVDCSVSGRGAAVNELKRNDDGCWIPYVYEYNGNKFPLTLKKTLTLVDEYGMGFYIYHNKGLQTIHETNALYDFFFMMEDLKPGGWLSNNSQQNPWTFETRSSNIISSRSPS